jgi:phosphohistidine phosphatase
MKLYVIRHAKATDFGESAWGGERPLTEKGLKQSEAIGQYFGKSSEGPELVLTSPILRAQQTADTLCHAAGLDAPLTVDWLRCGMRAEEAVSELAAYTAFECVAVVGHNPDLYFLLHQLLGNDAPAHVKKASVTELDGLELPKISARLVDIRHF